MSVLTRHDIEELVREALIDEGLWDKIKGFGSKLASGIKSGMPVGAAGRAHRPPAHHGAAGADDKKDDDTTTPEPPTTTPQPPTGPSLTKDAPLSVTKRQPQLKIGPGKNPQQQAAGGQKEAPLVMQMQKIGMSQTSAQQIAKRIKDYLEQRKIPVAEGIDYIINNGLLESTFILMEAKTPDRAKILSMVRKSILGQLQALMKDEASDASKQKGSQMALGMSTLAKSGNPDKFVKTLLRWAERGGKEVQSGKAGSRPAIKGWINSADGKAMLQAVPEEEILQFMTTLSSDSVFQKYHEAALKLRQAKAAGKAQRRGDIRGIGKSGREGEPGYKSQAANSIVGKIISRFVSDNQQLLDKDPGLQAIFDDPRKFNKLQKSVTNLLARQMQRRGYDAAEIQKFIGKTPGGKPDPRAKKKKKGDIDVGALAGSDKELSASAGAVFGAMEEMIAECVQEMTNLLITTNRISRWKVLSGVK